VALGGQGNEEIQARELATQAHTIPWEILTSIGARVPRIYKHFRSVVS
jgi:alanine racemase